MTTYKNERNNVFIGIDKLKLYISNHKTIMSFGLIIGLF